MAALEYGQEVNFTDIMTGWEFTGTFLGYRQNEYNRQYALVGYIKNNGENATARVLCGLPGEAVAARPLVVPVAA